MKVKLIISLFACLAMTALTANAQNSHDFTFGLSDEFPAVMSFSKDETGEDTFKRFQQVRSELPDELPIFEPYETEGKQAIYIAKNGDDSNSGTIDKPLKTFDEAFARTARADKSGDGFVIYVREGIYDMSNGLNIPDKISGTEDCPVIISAYPNENVKLTGGISVKGSEFKAADDETAMRKLPESSKGKVYSVNLKDLGYTEYPSITRSTAPKLTVDGTEYTVARWPNAENVAMKKYEGEDAVNGVIDQGPVAEGALTGAKPEPDYGQGFEFCILDPRPFSWENTDDIWVYGSFFAEYLQNYERVKGMNPEKSSLRMYGGNANYGANYNSHHTYYYLNVLEELDIPGEWYLDKSTGILYVYPVKDLKDSSVDIAMSTHSVVTFDKGTEYVVLNGIEVTGTTSVGIKLSGYRNVIQNCTVKECGSSVKYENAKNCGTICCKLYGSIAIDNTLTSKSVADDQNLRPTRNFIQNNIVYDAQINVRYGVQHIVSHNTILNCPGMCIYIANTEESIIEFNEVAGGPYRTIDGGMIYLEGGTNNIYNHVRYNYFHHSTMTIRNSPFGIYFDDVTSNCFAYGNIVQQGCMFMHGGSNNTYYNNVIIDNTSESPSVYNSNNYYRGGMLTALKRYLFGSSGVYWNNNGNMKIGQVTWKNRYPALYSFFEESRAVEKARLNPNYTFGELDKEWIRPRRGVYMNNLMYNSKPPTNDNELEDGTALWKDNYNAPKENSPFIDYDDLNYNIASYDELRKNIPTFEEIPSQERRGVSDIAEKVKQSEKIYPMSPIPPESGREFINNVSFKWTKNPEAQYYYFELSTDEKFENVIADKKSTYNYFVLPDNLDIDTTYYWRVTAYSYGQCVENKVVVMDTASFRTYTYEEAAARTTLDTSGYTSSRERIMEIVEKYVIEDNGTDIGIGVYKQGTKERIAKLIEDADKRMEGYALQAEVEKEIKYIDSEYINILNENAIPYVRTYKTMNISDWKLSNDTAAKLNVTGNELSIEASDNSVKTTHDIRMLSPKERVKVMINCGDMNDWNAFAVKQIATDKNMITGMKGYYIVFKKDAIELQRYPAVGEAIKTSVVNTGILQPNTWHEVEVGCEKTETGGSKITFIVDGKTIFDYNDEDSPINDLGYFSVQNNGADSRTIKIKGIE